MHIHLYYITDFIALSRIKVRFNVNSKLGCKLAISFLCTFEIPFRKRKFVANKKNFLAHLFSVGKQFHCFLFPSFYRPYYELIVHPMNLNPSKVSSTLFPICSQPSQSQSTILTYYSLYSTCLHSHSHLYHFGS